MSCTCGNTLCALRPLTLHAPMPHRCACQAGQQCEACLEYEGAKRRQYKSSRPLSPWRQSCAQHVLYGAACSACAMQRERYNQKRRQIWAAWKRRIDAQKQQEGLGS